MALGSVSATVPLRRGSVKTKDERTEEYIKLLNRTSLRASEIAQCLMSYSALLEDPGSVPSTRVRFPSPNTQLPGSPVLRNLVAVATTSTYTHMQVPIHSSPSIIKNKINLKRNGKPIFYAFR